MFSFLFQDCLFLLIFLIDNLQSCFDNLEVKNQIDSFQVRTKNGNNGFELIIHYLVDSDNSHREDVVKLLIYYRANILLSMGSEKILGAKVFRWGDQVEALNDSGSPISWGMSDNVFNSYKGFMGPLKDDLFDPF